VEVGCFAFAIAVGLPNMLACICAVGFALVRRSADAFYIMQIFFQCTCGTNSKCTNFWVGTCSMYYCLALTWACCVPDLCLSLFAVLSHGNDLSAVEWC